MGPLATTFALALSMALPLTGDMGVDAQWEVRGCDHGHGYGKASRGLRAALRHHQPLTRQHGRRAWHFALCTQNRDASKRLRVKRAGWLEWRKSYAHRWPIRFNGLDPGWQSWAYATGACESGNNPATDTGNGFFGAFQWVPSTWWAVGGDRWPTGASWHHQATLAVRLALREGTGHWPNCP